jgi:hypothetical protein
MNATGSDVEQSKDKQFKGKLTIKKEEERRSLIRKAFGQQGLFNHVMGSPEGAAAHEALEDAAKEQTCLIEKAVKIDPHAIGAKVATEQGFKDFSEGSPGRKKRDEVARAVEQEEKKSVDPDNPYFKAFVGELYKMRKIDGNITPFHVVKARDIMFSTAAIDAEKAIDITLARAGMEKKRVTLQTPHGPVQTTRWVSTKALEGELKRAGKEGRKQDEAETASKLVQRYKQEG